MIRYWHPEHGYHVVGFGDDIAALERAGWTPEPPPAAPEPTPPPLPEPPPAPETEPEPEKTAPVWPTRRRKG